MGAGSAQGEGLQPQRLCFQSLLLLPNKKLLFGNLLLLEEMGISFPREHSPSLFLEWALAVLAA